MSVKKPIVVAIIFAIIGLILDTVLYLQAIDLTKKRDQELTEQTQLLNEKHLLDELSSSLELKQKELEGVENMLPKTLDDFVLFTNDLSAVATASGQVMKLSSEPEPKKQLKDKFTYRTLGVSMDLTGSYPSVLSFFERFYSLPFYVTVEKIIIEKNLQEHGVKSAVKINLYMR